MAKLSMPQPHTMYIAHKEFQEHQVSLVKASLSVKRLWDWYDLYKEAVTISRLSQREHATILLADLSPDPRSDSKHHSWGLLTWQPLCQSIRTLPWAMSCYYSPEHPLFSSPHVVDDNHLQCTSSPASWRFSEMNPTNRHIVQDQPHNHTLSSSTGSHDSQTDSTVLAIFHAYVGIIWSIC